MSARVFAPSGIFTSAISPVIVESQPGRFNEMVADIQPLSLTKILDIRGPLGVLSSSPWKFGALGAVGNIASFNMHSGIFDGPTIASMIGLNSVKAIYEDRPMRLLQFAGVPPEGVFSVKVPGAGNTSSEMYFTSTEWTRKLLGADVANSKGYSGQGMNAVVVDTGGMKGQQDIVRMTKETVFHGNRADLVGHGGWCLSALGGTRTEDRYFSSTQGRPVICQGVAPMCNLFSVKALDYVIGTAQTSQLLKGLEMALAMKPDVISCSWGAPALQTQEADPFYPAVSQIVNSGVIFVAAIGNGGPGPSTTDSPGALEPSLSVGAYNAVTNTAPMFGNAGEISGFSSRGPTPWNSIKPDTCLAGDTQILNSDGIPQRLDEMKESSVYTIGEHDCSAGKFIRRFDNGVKDIIKIRSRHHTLFATADHRILAYDENHHRDSTYMLTECGSSRLSTFRLRSGISVKSMAQKLGISSYQSYDRIEKRRRGTSIDRLRLFFRMVGGTLERNDYEENDRRDHYDRFTEWRSAGSIKKGDVVFTADYVNAHGRVVKIPAIPPLQTKKSYALDIPDVITPDIARFLGFYLGDGSHNDYQVHLCTFARTEQYWNLILKIIPSVRMSKTGAGGNCILIHSRQISNLIDFMGFDGNARSKTVPDWVFEIDMECRQQFIEGYVDAGGHRRRNGSSIYSASRELAYRLHALCGTTGLNVSNIRCRTRKGGIIEGRELPFSTSYEFDIYGQKGSIGMPYVISSPIPGTRLERVSGIEDAGREHVYDIWVEPYHTYSANNFVVHNCAPGAIIDSSVPPISEMAISYTHRAHPYQSIAGTSMSAPQLAGIVLLMRQAHKKLLNKTLTNTEVKAMLAALGQPKNNNSGWGPLYWAMYEEWLASQYNVKV